MSFFFVQPQAKVHARVALIQSTYAWLSTHKHKFKIAKKKTCWNEVIWDLSYLFPNMVTKRGGGKKRERDRKGGGEECICDGQTILLEEN